MPRHQTSDWSLPVPDLRAPGSHAAIEKATDREHSRCCGKPGRATLVLLPLDTFNDFVVFPPPSAVAMSISRRRLHKQQNVLGKDRGDKASGASTPSPRVINAAPSLAKAEMYGIDDNRPVFSRAMALAGRVFIETIPQWLAVGAMLSLIFGGCCSNVFALESIIKVERESGTFIFRGGKM